MNKPRQFSLAYLLTEVTLIALSLGLTCQAYRTSDEYALLRSVLICVAIIAWGAAIGGLFQRMTMGLILGGCLVIGLLVLISMPRGAIW